MYLLLKAKYIPQDFFLRLLFLASFLLVSPVLAESWSKQELEQLKQYEFKKILAPSNDPSNKYLNNPLAVKFGKQLFNDTRLSDNQNVSCASCHIKEQGFTDNKMVALGARSGLRNTPTLFNVSQQNWFFWDGSKDSLWAQALGSLENPAEHAFTRTQMLHFISANKSYQQIYQQLFRHSLPSDKELASYPQKAGPNGSLQQLKRWKKLSKEQKNIVNIVFTNIGKAIAAYVSTIHSKPTRFDSFLKELLKSGSSTLLNEAEQRGLKLFISPATACINCHSGAIFSNKSFHNIGTGIPARDNGRSEVIDAVIRDEFNCLGNYSDAKPEQCLELKYANKDRHALSGTYKTPSLRGLSKTAPYMHDGRYKNLREVLQHYASIDSKKALETDLPEIKLSNKQQEDIIKFLLTL